MKMTQISAKFSRNLDKLTFTDPDLRCCGHNGAVETVLQEFMKPPRDENIFCEIFAGCSECNEVVMRNVDKNWNSLDDDTETCNESVAMFD